MQQADAEQYNITRETMNWQGHFANYKPFHQVK